MRLSLVVVGKLKEPWLRQGCDEYIRRISRHASVSVIEVPDIASPVNASPAQETQVREREGDKILAKINPKAYIFALDQRGKSMNSPKFALHLEALSVQGSGSMTFIIGGSLGLAPELLSRSDILLSFSAFTFPHQLMRLILLEQLYRACKIMAGETYHK